MLDKKVRFLSRDLGWMLGWVKVKLEIGNYDFYKV